MKKQKKAGRYALVWHFLKGCRWLFVMCIVMSGLMALADMITPQIIRAAIDNALGGQEPNFGPAVMALVNHLGGFAYLGQHLWIMALAVIAVALIKVLSQYGYAIYNTRGA